MNINRKNIQMEMAFDAFKKLYIDPIIILMGKAFYILHLK